MAWVHREDLIGIVLAALGDERWSGPVNATAPEPVSNRELSHALGRALHRPRCCRCRSSRCGVLYGEMAQIITTGVRAVPARRSCSGTSFAHPHLDEALAAALG